MQEFLDRILFPFDSGGLTVGQIILLIVLIGFGVVVYYGFSRSKLVENFYTSSSIEPPARKKLFRIIRYLIIFVLILLIVQLLDIDYLLYSRNNYDIRVSLLLKALLILQGARLFDWLISNILIHKYYIRRDLSKTHHGRTEVYDVEQTASKVVQYIVYVAAAILLLKNLNLDFSIYSTTVGSGENTESINFRITNLFSAILILLISRMVVWFITQLFLYGVYKRRGVDKGSQFAINQLLKYFIYFIAVLIALDHIGINMTLIWTGAAALLVGIGLGLQQTFNDFVSGVVLLFERSTSVGDILEFGGTVGIVREIGLRASVIETRQNVSMVVPNSKLVNDNVINWSHYDNKVRFDVSVGVAYGSDTDLVRTILVETAKSNKDVMKFPSPFVRFMDFGNSSLDFTVFFFSRNFMFIEDVKSEIRFEIDRRFRENGVTVPFPQRDVWFKNDKNE
jgi:small-conductance mechanosensitive channel